MALNAYLSIKGQKQGQFKGDVSKTHTHDKWMEVHSFEYGVASPHDVNVGNTTGKRQHNPVVVTKAGSPAGSPQIFQAHMTKEPLTEVVIESRMYGAVRKKITLRNAVLTKFERSTTLPKQMENRPSEGYVTLEFAFEEIQSEGA